MIQIVKAIPALIAAILVGNWFLAETRKAKLQNAPWYQPYLTVPGILILVGLSLPVLIWAVRG